MFRKDNLVAWCIVPFDAKQRGPEERAAMLERLGIRRMAYDWRDKDIATFDQELEALQKHGIELTAFWFPCDLEPEKNRYVKLILEFLKRRNVRTQLWLSLGVPDTLTTQEEKVAAAARAIGYVSAEAEKIGCKVGLYNHGGWFGEPENQIAIIQRLKMPNVRIVYNFHHGHDHLNRFPELLKKMRPHLMALNLNGMVTDGERLGKKIVPIGQGDRDFELLKMLRDSGYRGPIGILGHREQFDVEVILKENLSGLKALLERLGEREAVRSY